MEHRRRGTVHDVETWRIEAEQRTHDVSIWSLHVERRAYVEELPRHGDA